MAVIVDIDHEGGTLGEYTTTVEDGGDLSVAAGAALAGTNYGLSVAINDATAIYGEYDIGAASTTGIFRVRIYFDINSLTMATGDIFRWFQAQTSTGYTETFLIVEFYKLNSTTYQVRPAAYNDAAGANYLTSTTFTDAEHYVEFLVTRATNADSNDGVFSGWLDGVEMAGGYTNLDNYNRFDSFDQLRVGMLTGRDTGTSGTFYVDEIVANDDGSEIGDESSSSSSSTSSSTTSSSTSSSTTSSSTSSSTTSSSSSVSESSSSSSSTSTSSSSSSESISLSSSSSSTTSSSTTSSSSTSSSTTSSSSSVSESSSSSSSTSTSSSSSSESISLSSSSSTSSSTTSSSTTSSSTTSSSTTSSSTTSSSSTSSSTTSSSSSSSTTSSSSSTSIPPGGIPFAWGEENPLLGESPIAWTTWDDGAAGAVTVQGDASWGKLELDVGEEGRSAVYDLGAAGEYIYTLTENRYGTGEGTATLQYRGHVDTAFNQDDALPAWNDYTIPFTVTWRYIQVRLIKSA